VADNTHIQWTDKTLNVISGCTKISDGCIKCYIERTPPFRMAGRKFDKPGIGGTTGVVLHEDRLRKPLGWRKACRVFVCSLADLFHDEVPDEFIARLFAVMVACPQHTFQLLTKRHARLRALLTDARFWQAVSVELGILWKTDSPAPLRAVPPWIWIGVSAENQQWANVRIPALLSIPAHTRWVSAEPLIGPIVLRDDWVGTPSSDKPALRWLVAGGESGPGARPCDVAWIRSLVAQCQAGSTIPFVKQLGATWGRANAADSKGGDWSYWPESLRVRDYPADRVAVPS
jgi:protein gp37